MARVVVRVHPHRVNFGNNDLPKNYVHVSSWGPEPRAFYDVEINVPCKFIYNNAGCGCTSHIAQAYVEVVVLETQITWTERLIAIGTKKGR